VTQTRNLIDENGKRTDGRGIDELRPVKITVGSVKNANGSAFIEFGKN
jgi:exosome complex component RRP41